MYSKGSTCGLVLVAGAAFAIAGCGGAGSAGSGSSGQSAEVTVSGASSVRIGGTTQYTATVSGLTNAAVTWEVNGTAGGAAATGVISTSGLYSPPSTAPKSDTVTITAVSVEQPSASGSISVSILNPVPAIDSANATLTSSGNYLLDVHGAGFVDGAWIDVAGVQAATTFISGRELEANITIPSGTSSIEVTVSNPDPGSASSGNISAPVYQASVAAADRLLDQTGFGPTAADIQHVQKVGLDAYLTEQFDTPATLEPDISSPPPAECAKTPVPCQQSEWWQVALTAPDQLRQRVAFALSEMFVVSTDSVNARAVTAYANILAKDAFGNFFTLMHDVTLSPAMGNYLNMLNSGKAGPGEIANENFPREMMQLFTIGLDELNPDGSLKLDSNGQPIPTYTQTEVMGFAKAYTGWTYATASGGAPSAFPNQKPNYDHPMEPVESAHDTTSKALLNGVTLPAGQTAAQDLHDALEDIFDQPNVGPFICRELIQHLVTSSPSPSYVARVSAVFDDDGAGVRGNLQAVIHAILMDPEARAGDTDPTYDGGHLREPILWLTSVLRGLGFTDTSADGSYASLSQYSSPLGEAPYRANSVFDFFPPQYVIPGTSLNAPEFALENTASATLQMSLADRIVSNKLSGIQIDLSASSPLGQLASESPDDLVSALDVLFLHGQMPSNMHDAIVTAVSGLANPAQQARVAVYLVITSPEYKVIH